VTSKNIYLSTQPSGKLSNIDDQLNQFRAALSNVPLQTGMGEYGVLRLIDAKMYRNFYYVNSHNNKFNLNVTIPSASAVDVEASIPAGDYAYGNALALAFATAIKDAVRTVTGLEKTVITGTTEPTETSKGATGTGIFKCVVEPKDSSDASVQNVLIKIQTRNYSGGDTNNQNYNDSYALLGGKRITADDPLFSNESFSSVTDRSQVTITGFYPMQRSTMPTLFLRCSEVVDNLESENFRLGQTASSDTHIQSSTILGKLDVGDEFCSYSGDSSSPYYIMSDNRNISELFFRVVDQHGRKLPPAADQQASLGNLHIDMTIKFEVYTKGTGQPVNNNVENNALRNAMIQKGGIN